MIVCMYIVDWTGYEEFRTGSSQSKTRVEHIKLVIAVSVKVLFIFMKSKTDFSSVFV